MGGKGAGSIAALFVLVLVEVLVVLIVVLIPVVVVLVFFLFLFVLIVVFGGPAFRFRDPLQIQLVPGVQVDLFDVTVEVFDFHQLGVGVDGQHAKAVVLFGVFVPLPGYWFVIASHR